MKRYDLITPEGTKDLLFDECIVRREIEEKLHSIFENHGYCEIITPGIEFFDVFSLNSGYFPQETLYKTTDNKGRLVVSRPDLTIPIARVIATRLKDAMLPLRFYYSQCIYANNPSLKGRSDEVFQTGIELVGSSAKIADLEVITMAIDALSAFGEDNFTLEIGDVGFFRELVNQLDVDDETKERIRQLIEGKNYPALNDLLDSIGDNKVTYALKQLPRLFGGESVFDKAAELFSDSKTEEILSNLKELYKDIKKFNTKCRINVDLGLVNRTDYYTGVIIKGYLEGYGEEILSGGRYDKLISEFGYDAPATGFAVNVDAVSKVISSRSKRHVKPSDIIVFSSDGNEIKAMKTAEKLRNDGKVVEVALVNDMECVREYAKVKHISKIMIVENDVTEVL